MIYIVCKLIAETVVKGKKERQRRSDIHRHTFNQKSCFFLYHPIHRYFVVILVKLHLPSLMVAHVEIYNDHHTPKKDEHELNIPVNDGT